MQARHAAGREVEDLREEAAPPWILALRLPAGDEVEAFLELGKEARDLGGIVLEIAVDRDHDLAASLEEAGLEGRRLAEVAAQADDADFFVSGVEPGERGEGAVG